LPAADLKSGRQGISVGRQERCRKRHGRVSDRNNILLAERVLILSAQDIHCGTRLLYGVPRWRIVPCVLFENSNPLAEDSGNGIFHGHHGIFTGKECGEVSPKILQPQRCPHGQCRLDEIGKIHIDKNSAGATQLIQRRVHDFRHVGIEGFPVVSARETDPDVAQVGRREFRLLRDRGMNESDIGNIARHRSGNIEFELERYDAFDRIRLIGLGVVYTRFRIAPRVALTSENPNSGKSTALEVARCLVFRPNPETLGTGAAIADFLNGGPCTVLLDEIDQVDAEGRRRLQLLWNLGHARGARTSLMVGGRRKLVSLHAPVLAAGVGRFLAPSQQSRTFTLEMEEYTAETKPEREFDDADTEDLNAVNVFLRHWAARVKLDPKPAMPPGVLSRFADNVKGLLAIADSCGEEWRFRAHEAVVAMLAKEKAERPQIVLIRHGLLIFEIYELDQIGSVQFNKELLRLDLPDARWTQYRGASGTVYLHPLRMDEQATLLGKVGIRSMRIRPPGKRQCFGYKLAQFQEAQRKHGVAAPQESELRRERLRLVGPSD
jgi:Protein of unknown function (DUF3631)